MPTAMKATPKKATQKMCQGIQPGMSDAMKTSPRK